jgi:hypothetical protein
MNITPLTRPIRSWLRRRHAWIKFRDLHAEGWRNAWTRRRFQRVILDTTPIRTAPAGRPVTVEVHALTWHRDWVNALWALKSFYHFAGVDYPLVIHDGGLRPGQARALLAHFPDATLISKVEADRRMAELGAARGLERCLAYRRTSGCAAQFLDFLALSDAEHVIGLDSDVLFFARPDLLIVPPEGLAVNRYNRDDGVWYAMGLDEIEAAFAVRPVPHVNAGVMIVRRSSFDLDTIESWLRHPGLFDEPWLTAQTIHAMASTVAGVELLPDTYVLATSAGVPEGAVCKHYPGYYRQLLYTEGMDRLIRSGFLDRLRASANLS